jgi:hypothetical protein
MSFTYLVLDILNHDVNFCVRDDVIEERHVRCERNDFLFVLQIRKELGMASNDTRGTEGARAIKANRQNERKISITHPFPSPPL